MRAAYLWRHNRACCETSQSSSSSTARWYSSLRPSEARIDPQSPSGARWRRPSQTIRSSSGPPLSSCSWSCSPGAPRPATGSCLGSCSLPQRPRSPSKPCAGKRFASSRRRRARYLRRLVASDRRHPSKTAQSEPHKERKSDDRDSRKRDNRDIARRTRPC